MTQTLALCIGRYLARQGLLERDEENSYLAGGEREAGVIGSRKRSDKCHLAVWQRPDRGRLDWGSAGHRVPAMDDTSNRDGKNGGLVDHALHHRRAATGP
jgi:hypothetical protein